ncbi:hypothetical protein CYY_001952 [Polysphondylium violaceum]|uniref:Vps52 / Sac2 family protein n=1 Tax=Polysphondylium violaceum TaxID=133409 RepID=A0A8J4PYY4_9MYCE|nr:hypothetical protein CYY_001952 [Polysphondylium violaceum]
MTPTINGTIDQESNRNVDNSNGSDGRDQLTSSNNSNNNKRNLNSSSSNIQIKVTYDGVSLASSIDSNTIATNTTISDDEDDDKHKQQQHSSKNNQQQSQQDDDDGGLELNMYDYDFTNTMTIEDIENLEEQMQFYATKEKVIENSMNKNIDLNQFSNQVQEALVKYDDEMKALYNDIIPDYVNERENFATMYKTLKESGNILTGFEEMLKGFQNDLTSITHELKALQDLSINENVKYKNRKLVVEKLTKVVEELCISKDLIKVLSESEVNDQYLQYLSIFSKKIGYIQTQKSNGVAATAEIEEVIVKLLNTVLDKIYKFFTLQFGTIKDFNSLQSKQQEFTLYRNAFIFLYKHTRRVARKLFEQYKDISERIYSSYYKSYVQFLEKLQIEPTSKNDSIAAPDSKTKGFFSSKSNKLKIKASIYSIETRFQILNEIDLPPLKPQSITSEHSASSNQIKYSYEIIFRSLLFFAIDLVGYENMFIKDYFLSNKDSSNELFGKSEALLMENLNSFLSSTYDIVAILLIICITSKYRTKSNFKSECTDRIYHHIIINSLTRLSVLFDENIQGVRNANTKDLCPVEENRPHYVMRRYSELIGSFAVLYSSTTNTSTTSAAAEDNINTNTHLLSNVLESHKLINESLAILRVEMFKLINRLSEEFKDKKLSKSIFLLNNYDLVLTILSDKLDDNSSNDDRDYWSALYDKEAEQYAVEQLMCFPYFKRIINLVKDLYPLINLYTLEEINHPQLKKEIHESILKDFSTNWRSGIEEMNVIVTQLFPNFKNGMKILQMILDNLFTNYKHFTQIILKYFKTLKTSPYFIPETEISYEIKKYYVSFD